MQSFQATPTMNAAPSVIARLERADEQVRQFEVALDRLGERREIDGVYSFINPPNNRQWQSFQELAGDILSLDVKPGYASILQMVCFMVGSRGAFPFPNLRHLRWSARSSQDLVDMSNLIVPTLVDISLQLPDIPPWYLHNIYQLLISNVSQLRSFQVGLPDHVQYVAPQVFPTMANILNFYASTLTEVQIPTAFITPYIIQCLSNMPNLSEMHVGFSSCPTPGLVDPPQHAPSNRRGYFTSLRYFSYHGTLQTLSENFFRAFDISTLSVFHWDVENGEVSHLKGFLQLIEGCCPRLTELSLGTRAMYLLEGGEPPVVGWSAIRGLLECRYLTSISLYYARVDIDKRQLATLLKSRLTWQRVELYTLRPLELEDIFLYGRYCSHLTSLGMTLVAPSADAVSRLNNSFPAVLPRLHELDLGNSNISSIYCGPIGTFLFKVSKRPVYVEGYDGELWQGINRTIANLYIHKAASRNRPLSRRVREYIYTVNLNAENMEMDLEGDGSEEESDEE